MLILETKYFLLKIYYYHKFRSVFFFSNTQCHMASKSIFFNISVTRKFDRLRSELARARLQRARKLLE